MGDATRKFTRRVFFSLSAALAGTYFLWKNFFRGGRAPDAVTKTPQIQDTKIVKAAIFPGIGIARIGNSRTPGNDFFIGPEVTEPPPATETLVRDASGAIKRQAARFRVYGLNAANQVVSELTSSLGAEIEWQVHLANRKADWFRFLVAMDADGARPCPRRNRKIKGKDRKGLVIDSGLRMVSGRSQAGVPCDGGKFQGKPVYLGELRTDEEGRLLVLGGLGQSESPQNTLIYDQNDGDTFNNADGWYDDISDGPVHARVKLNGQELPLLDGGSAWVAVAPPNFAPDIIGWRTMFELLVDTHVRAGMIAKPVKTSFNDDVWPLLDRLSRHEWLNQGFAEQFGWQGKVSFREGLTAAGVESLNSSEAQRSAIKQMFDSFRIPERASAAKKDIHLWPMLYGDAYGGEKPVDSINLNFVVPPIQTMHLENWVKGNYKNDWTPNREPFRELAQVPVHEQPAMLDKSALHFCLADAFHPGCELTWPMRHASMYRQPLVVSGMASFRIKERAAGAPEPDYGDVLNVKNAFTAKGPLNAQGAGDLTKWMALPWQGDTLFCRSGYDYEIHPFLPAYWPARVPNQVLSQDNYDRMMAADNADVRKDYFNTRDSWFRNMPRQAVTAMHEMIRGFGSMGILLRRDGPKGDATLPEVMYVESLPDSAKQKQRSRMKSAAPGAAGGALESTRAGFDPAVRAGWEDAQQAEDFRAIRFGRKRKR